MKATNILDPDQQKKKNAETVICGLMLSYILFFSAYTYLFILFYLHDQQILEKYQESSNIILYISVSLILQFITSIIEYCKVDFFKLRDQELSPTTKSWNIFNVSRIVFYSIMVFWGNYELYSNSTIDLQSTSTWKLAQIGLILQIVFGIFVNTFLTIHGFAKTYLESKQISTDRSSNNSFQYGSIKDNYDNI